MRRLCIVLGFVSALMTAASAFGGAHNITLKNSAIVFHIDARTGTLAGSGKILAPCFDRYVWMDKTTDKQGTEQGDRVTRIIRSPRGKSVTLECINDATGLKIAKHYRLQDNPVRLLKKITFTGRRGFVLYHPVVNADERFRSESYYHRFTYYNYSDKSPRILCSQVRRDIPMANPSVIMVNRKQDVTLAAYFYAVNGHVLFPQQGVSSAWNQWALTPTGWRMGMWNVVSPDGGHSFTVAYEIRKGNELDYNLAMANSSETLALQGPEPSGWGSRIAWRAPCDWVQVKHKHAMAALADRTPWGYGLWEYWGWFAPYYGDYASKKQDAVNSVERTIKEPYSGKQGAGSTENPAKIAALFRGLERLSPRLKIGCYVMPATFNASSKVFRAHPNWILYNRDGKPYNGGTGDYAPKDPCYWLRVSAPGVLKYWRSRIRGIMTTLGAQFVYLDGGVGGIQGGGSTPDWRTYSVDQYYDYSKLWRLWQNITHRYGGVVLCNNPVSAFDDGGFLECNSYAIYRKNWKTMTDRITYAKIWSRPGNPLSVVGGGGDSGIHSPYIRLEVNWWFIFGLTPCFLNNQSNIPSAIKVTLSYIAAAYELRRRVIVQAHVRPAWEGKGVDVEVHAQKVSGAGLLSIMNHAGHLEKYRIETHLRPLGIKPGNPLYTWVYNMRPVDKPGRRLQGPARLRGCFDTHFLRFTEAAPSRFVFDDPVPDELAQLVVLTSSPALIYEVDGQECPLALPSTLGISTSGVLDTGRRQLDLLVHTDKPGKLLAVIPQGWNKVSGMIRPTEGNGLPVTGLVDLPVRVTTMYGSKVAVVAFPGHDSDIVLSHVVK